MSAAPTLSLDPSLEPRPVRPALVWGLDLSTRPTAAAPDYLRELLGRVGAEGESHIAPERKAAVRNMLRYGKYKPAGRSKPSSEYLLAAALAGEFPLVNGPVDINNAVSLQWGYPASVFDMAKTGPELVLRRGKRGESYLFNPSGQEIDLEDLLVVCRPVEPCGNPVKDAMATKVFEDATDIVAVVYAPVSEGREDVEACAARFARLLSEICGARASGYRLY